MQHIDDGTLHALLDGALKAEEPAAANAAEAHLEACAQCRARLDAAAESRRRASEILGTLGTGAAGDFEEVVARAAALSGTGVAPHAAQGPERALAGGALARRARRVRRTRAAAWAATIVLALGTGWVIRDQLGPDLAAIDVVSIPAIDVEAEAAPRQRGEAGAHAGGADVAGTDAAAPVLPVQPAPPAEPAGGTSVAGVTGDVEATRELGALAGGAEPPRQPGTVAAGTATARLEDPVALTWRAEGPLGTPARVTNDLIDRAAVTLDEHPIRTPALAARVEAITGAAPTADARALTRVQPRLVSVEPLEAAAAVVRYAMDHGLGRWEGRDPEVLCVTTPVDGLEDLRALVGHRGQAIVPVEECELHSSSDPPLAPRVRHLPTLRSALILRLGSIEPVIQPGISAHLQIPVAWEAGHHYGGTLQCELERRDGQWEVRRARE